MSTPVYKLDKFNLVKIDENICRLLPVEVLNRAQVHGRIQLLIIAEQLNVIVNVQWSDGCRAVRIRRMSMTLSVAICRAINTIVFTVLRY